MREHKEVNNLGPIPEKIGIYLCVWKNGEKYYNVFNGKEWCWGAGLTKDNVPRSIDSLIGEIGRHILADHENETSENVCQYLVPITNSGAYWQIVSYTLVAELGVSSE